MMIEKQKPRRPGHIQQPDSLE